MKRLDANPLLTPSDLEPTSDSLEVICTLNPAAIKFKGEYLLLVRIGEKAQEDAYHVYYISYDSKSDQTVVKGILKDDPDLKISDTRGYFYKGQMLLTSMSHLRIARSVNGVDFVMDPHPAIFPTKAYEGSPHHLSGWRILDLLYCGLRTRRYSCIGVHPRLH